MCASNCLDCAHTHQIYHRKPLPLGMGRNAALLSYGIIFFLERWRTLIMVKTVKLKLLATSEQSNQIMRFFCYIGTFVKQFLAYKAKAIGSKVIKDVASLTMTNETTKHTNIAVIVGIVLMMTV